MCIYDHVQQRTRQKAEASFIGGCRVGTITVSDSEALYALLGEAAADDGDKVKRGRYEFETPVGPHSLYVYWWNSQGIWSVGGHSKEAQGYIAAYLRQRFADAGQAVTVTDELDEMAKAGAR